MSGLSHKIKVIQSYSVWLEATDSWLYAQIQPLPSSIESHLVCERTKNLDRFPMPQLWSVDEQSPFDQWRHRLAKKLGRNSSHFLREICSITSASIVHSHTGQVGWANHRSVPNPIRHLVSLYAADLHRLSTGDSRVVECYQQMTHDVDRILCESPSMAVRLIQHGCPESKVIVKPLGIDLSTLCYQPLRFDGKQLRVLLCGLFEPTAGFPDAILALGRLRRCRPSLEIEVTILGEQTATHASPIEHARIMAILTQWGIKATFPGYPTDERRLAAYASHHLLLAPYRLSNDGNLEGGTPLPILEAQACGLMIGSTRHGEIPHIVPKETRGLLAPEADPQAMCDRLDAILDMEWGSILQAQRKHMETHFDSVMVAEKLAEIYASLV